MKKYAVKEVFRTIQGEGENTGRPAVFLRHSGCNLWSGREEDRDKGKGACSRWCDSSFFGTDGVNGGVYTAQELAHKCHEVGGKIRFVVLTGGEPLLQADEELLFHLHELGFWVAVETNGTIHPKATFDHVCVSPKGGTELVLTAGDELKLVYPQAGMEPAKFKDLAFRKFYLQPLDDVNWLENTKKTIDYCLDNPQWSVSFQCQKFVNIP